MFMLSFYFQIIKSRFSKMLNVNRSTKASCFYFWLVICFGTHRLLSNIFSFMIVADSALIEILYQKFNYEIEIIKLKKNLIESI